MVMLSQSRFSSRIQPIISDSGRLLFRYERMVGNWEVSRSNYKNLCDPDIVDFGALGH